MATLLLCSDEPILAKGLSVLLSRTGEFDSVFYCEKVEDLCSALELHQPDVLLLDLTDGVTFGVLSGLQNLCEHTRIILWAHSISTELALQAVSLGVRGILQKTLPIETLLGCLVRVTEGGLWFHSTMTDSVMSAERFSLTRREGQLVVLVAQGLRNSEIASALNISEGTVKVYLTRLFQKLGVSDRFELALYGLKNLSAGVGTSDLSAARAPQSATASVMRPPRSFFVERIPAQSHQNELRPLAVSGPDPKAIRPTRVEIVAPRPRSIKQT